MINGKPTRKERSAAFYKVLHVPTDMEYVGSTNDVYTREAVHRSRLKLGIHPNKNLQEAFNNNPTISFQYEPTDTKEVALAKEQRYLLENAESGKLFNKALDVMAPGKGIIPSEETRKKISEAGLGRRHTNETKVQMSISSLGKNSGTKRTDTHKAAISNRHKGVPLSDEHRSKLHQARQLMGKSVVVIDGNEYPTKVAAAKELGISKPTVSARINNPNFPNWSIRVSEKEENE